MKFITNSCIFILLIAALPTNAQDVKQLKSMANELVAKEAYTNALPLYIEIDRLLPSNESKNQLADCYQAIPKERDKSIVLYEQLAMQTNTPLAIYKLGIAYQNCDLFSKAQDTYQRILTSTKSTLIFEPEIKKRIAQCQQGVMIMNRQAYLPEPANAVCNTEFNEIAPVYNEQCNTIMFASARPTCVGGKINKKGKPDEVNGTYTYDIFMSQLVNGTWCLPLNLGTESNTASHEKPACFLPGDKQIYITKTENKDNDNLVTVKYNTSWKIEATLPEPVSSNMQEQSCTITADGKNLYFVSNRAGGVGGMDIYVSFRAPNGNWSEPKNLGPRVNSPYDEQSPHITKEGELYFSSNNNNSIGGFDVFKTKFDDGAWTQPINLGYGINTVDDELYFSINKINGLQGTFCSNRIMSQGGYDLYKVDMNKTYDAKAVQAKLNPTISGLTLNQNKIDEEKKIADNETATKLAREQNDKLEAEKLARIKREKIEEEVLAQKVKEAEASANKAIEAQLQKERQTEALKIKQEKDANVAAKKQAEAQQKLEQKNKAIATKNAKLNKKKNQKIALRKIKKNKKEVTRKHKEAKKLVRNNKKNRLLAARNRKKNAAKLAAANKNLTAEQRAELEKKKFAIASAKAAFELDSLLMVAKQKQVNDSLNAVQTLALMSTEMRDILSQLAKINVDSLLNAASINVTQMQKSVSNLNAKPLIISKNLYYMFGDSKLTAESVLTLNNLVFTLLKYPDLIVQLVGHTDARGAENFNTTLAQLRVDVLKQYLIEHRIAPSRVMTIGYGEYFPIAKNAIDATETEQGKAANRRVEVRLANVDTASVRWQIVGDNVSQNMIIDATAYENEFKGLNYKIEICRSKSGVNPSWIKNLEPIMTEGLEGNMTAYLVGNLKTYSDAVQRSIEIGKQKMIRKPIVVAYYEGKRISIEKAMMLTNNK